MPPAASHHMRGSRLASSNTTAITTVVDTVVRTSPPTGSKAIDGQLFCRMSCRRDHHDAAMSNGTLTAHTANVMNTAVMTPAFTGPRPSLRASRGPRSRNTASTANVASVAMIHSISKKRSNRAPALVTSLPNTLCASRCGGLRSPGTFVRSRRNAATAQTATAATAMVAGLAMRVAVISDIHANYHALETVLAEIDAARVDVVWCLGDTVGYGPRPNDCCETVKSRAEQSLVGNHDLVVAGGLAPGGTEVQLSGRWLLNPGSVGQPRDGDPRAAWLLLDLQRRFAAFHRVAYPIEKTQSEMRERRLPPALAARLERGE